MKPPLKLETPPDLQGTIALSGARVAIDPWHAVHATVLVRNAKIEAILPSTDAPSEWEKRSSVIDLKGHLVLPGLINAHDHLQFGAFPRLGRGPYPSWREWASDIYRPDEPPLRSLLEIPKDQRLWSGIVRNALAGVTTVCHHDETHPLLTSGELPLSVHTRFGWSHSLDDFNWMERYERTPVEWPFVVHFAEGVDPRSRREAGKLQRRARLDDRIVLIHAIGILRRDWLRLRSAGVWVVWCPTSNLHILGRTLPRDLLLSYPSIALGSDSPISAAGDILDELQAARDLLDLPADLLYRMVTCRPARLLRLSENEGTISRGGAANLLILRDTGKVPCESLVTLRRCDLAAVMHKGRITVASEEFFARDASRWPRRFKRIERHGLYWHVPVPSNRANGQTTNPGTELDLDSIAEMTNQ